MFTKIRTNNYCKITFNGACNSDDISQLTALLQDRKLSEFEIDLRGLAVINSTLLSIMVQMSRQDNLKIYNYKHTNLMALLELTGLGQILGKCLDSNKDSDKDLDKDSK